MAKVINLDQVRAGLDADNVSEPQDTICTLSDVTCSNKEGLCVTYDLVPCEEPDTICVLVDFTCGVKGTSTPGNAGAL
jgi:hypothetical protein